MFSLGARKRLFHYGDCLAETSLGKVALHQVASLTFPEQHATLLHSNCYNPRNMFYYHTSCVSRYFVSLTGGLYIMVHQIWSAIQCNAMRPRPQKGALYIVAGHYRSGKQSFQKCNKDMDKFRSYIASPPHLMGFLFVVVMLVVCL